VPLRLTIDLDRDLDSGAICDADGRRSCGSAACEADGRLSWASNACEADGRLSNDELPSTADGRLSWSVYCVLTNSTFGCDDMTPRRNRNAEESREVASVMQDVDLEMESVGRSSRGIGRSGQIERIVIC
jgi:hypothetical protein